MNLPQKFHSKVVKKEQIGTKFVTVSLALDSPIDFLPGQYISVLVGDGVKRPYSICSSPSSKNSIELLIGLLENGIGSNYFRNLKVGDIVDFMGPYGKFVLPQKMNGNVWFIATGSGLAPLNSMIESLIEKKYQDKIRLIFGTRYENDLPFFNHFINIARNFKKFHYHIAISRPLDTFHPSQVDSDSKINWEDYWQKGYVTEIVSNLLKKEIPKYVFICGHNQMMKDIEKLLTKSGVAEEKILKESYL